MVELPWRVVWKFLNNLNMYLIIWSGHFTPSHLFKRKKNARLHKDFVSTYECPAQLHVIITKTCKQLKDLSTGKWINQVQYIPAMQY